MINKQQIIRQHKLNFSNMQSLLLPLNSQILSVDFDNNSLILWILIDLKERKTEKRQIKIFKQREVINNLLKKKFIGTVHFKKNVFHIFEVK